MTVLGTHVPVSAWSVAVMLAGIPVCGATSGAVARRWGWRARPTFAAMLLLFVTLGLTVTPDGTAPGNGLAACIPLSWADVPVDISHDGGGLAGALLNVALFCPLAACLTIAARRTWPVLAALAVLPPVVELAQTVIPGRNCAVSDVLTNYLGIVLGAVVGILVNRWNRRTVEPTR